MSRFQGQDFYKWLRNGLTNCQLIHLMSNELLEADNINGLSTERLMVLTGWSEPVCAGLKSKAARYLARLDGEQQAPSTVEPGKEESAYLDVVGQRRIQRMSLQKVLDLAAANPDPRDQPFVVERLRVLAGLRLGDHRVDEKVIVRDEGVIIPAMTVKFWKGLGKGVEPLPPKYQDLGLVRIADLCPLQRGGGSGC